MDVYEFKTNLDYIVSKTLSERKKGRTGGGGKERKNQSTLGDKKKKSKPMQLNSSRPPSTIFNRKRDLSLQ